jgi:hypothetical protein
MKMEFIPISEGWATQLIAITDFDPSVDTMAVQFQ